MQEKTKNTKNIILEEDKQKKFSHPVKCYLKLYQNNGLANALSNPPTNYQILDENTLLRKLQHSQKYEMLTYSKIFSARITTNLMSKNINFIDDLYDGINHTILAVVNSHTKKSFTIGSLDHQGIFIEYFLSIYYDCKHEYIKKNNRFYFSLFSTINNKPNHYIDLLTGQRYTFLSKKEVQSSYKTFYERKIQGLQDYLIALKIAMIRYSECCSEQDFMVYRISIENEDQFTETKVSSTGNLIICHDQNKYLQLFLKHVQDILDHTNTSKISDHGSLYSCLEPYLKNGKISILHCLSNQYDEVQKNLPFVRKMLQTFMPKTSSFKINKQDTSLPQFQKQISRQDQIVFSANQLASMPNKELDKIKSVYSHYKSFLKDCGDKIGSILRFYKKIYEIRQDFYEKERFPISIQIKYCQDTMLMIKAYYIAKIYSLSWKFQIQDIEPICQKMLTIRNQIQISIKSMMTIAGGKKKPNESLDQESSFLGKDTFPALSPNKESNFSQIGTQKQNAAERSKAFTRAMRKQLSWIRKNFKYVLTLNIRGAFEIKKQNGQIKCQCQLDRIDLSKLIGSDFNNQIQTLIKSRNKSEKLKQAQKNKNQQRQEYFLYRLPSNNEEVYKGYQPKSKHQSPDNSRLILLKEKIKPVQSSIFRLQKIKNKYKASSIIKGNKQQNQFLQKSLLKIKQSQLEKDSLIRSSLMQHKQKKNLDIKTKNQMISPQMREKVSLMRSMNTKQLTKSINKGQFGLIQNYQRDRQFGLIQNSQRDENSPKRYFSVIGQNNKLNQSQTYANKNIYKKKQMKSLMNASQSQSISRVKLQFVSRHIEAVFAANNVGKDFKQNSPVKAIAKKSVRMAKNKDKLSKNIVRNQMILHDYSDRENLQKASLFPEINVVCRKLLI